MNFSRFWAATRISELMAPKWLEIIQDNVRMKFSTLNVNFSNLSPNILGSKRPAHASVKEGFPS